MVFAMGKCVVEFGKFFTFLHIKNIFYTLKEVVNMLMYEMVDYKVK